MKASELLSDLLRREGAVAYGVTAASPVDEAHWIYFRNWLDAGRHAGMAYMENHGDLRRDPRGLLEGCRSVVSVAFNYRQTNPYDGVATYALGEDYHKVLRRRLKRVIAGMRVQSGGEWRICIDSAPVLERYWACKCGVGWRSHTHGNVVVPGVGSMVFLAELLTTLELPAESENFVTEKRDLSFPDGDRRTGCRACPTGALLPDATVDSRRCVNYLTIEHTGEWTEEEATMAGKAKFGCDICQRVSPENRQDAPPVLPEFLPLPGIEEFLRGEESEFPLQKSPMKRGKIGRKASG